MIDHAQPRPFEIVSQGSAFIRSGDENGLVHCVRRRQHNIGVARLEAVGGAKHVDLPILECGHDRLAGVEAQDAHGQAGGFGDDVGVIGRQAFVVASAGGEIEGRVIRGGSSQDQLLPIL
ncbi:hypothetical protein D3C84_906900 [compost metagenome]